MSDGKGAQSIGGDGFSTARTEIACDKPFADAHSMVVMSEDYRLTYRASQGRIMMSLSDLYSAKQIPHSFLPLKVSASYLMAGSWANRDCG